MSFVIFLRTCLFSLSILAGVIASPCQQKRDSSLDLFSSGETLLEDESLTLAFATTSDADFLSPDHADSNVSIFTSFVDGSSPATSESLFLETDSEGYSGQTLVAEQLPNFGGVTDFSFKELENGKSCPADKAPTTQSGRGKVPDLTNEIFQNDELTPEDKRRCPGAGGRQPIAVCCISVFEPREKVQQNCYRSTLIAARGLILCIPISRARFETKSIGTYLT